MAVEDT